MESDINAMLAIIEEIQGIYKEHRNNPSLMPPVECPCCKKPSTDYFCAPNNHVHYYCEHCGFKLHT